MTAAAEPRRKALHAHVTPEAHDQWHGFAAAQGVTTTGLLEAFGEQLVSKEAHAEQLAVVLLRVVARARVIDTRNRTRRGR